ncbi:hypothetical protein WM15_32660 [Burkholderia ubonensis]|nr:hypothetical protein WM15_32660 [Burkholderia ubonensis]
MSGEKHSMKQDTFLSLSLFILIVIALVRGARCRRNRDAISPAGRMLPKLVADRVAQLRKAVSRYSAVRIMVLTRVLEQKSLSQ